VTWADLPGWVRHFRRADWVGDEDVALAEPQAHWSDDERRANAYFAPIVRARRRWTDARFAWFAAHADELRDADPVVAHNLRGAVARTNRPTTTRRRP
jgi:hypothetical protein